MSERSEEIEKTPRAPSDRMGRSAPEPRSRRSVILPIVIGVVALLVAGSVYYWFTTRYLETTDDAVIDGDYVQVTPRVGGTVVALHIGDNQVVRQGDLLLEIDPRDYEAAAANAAATLASAEAQAHQAKASLDLTRASTIATLAQAEAGVEQAKAAIAQSQAQMVATQAEVTRARQDAVRYADLVAQNIASRQRFEQAGAQARTADAQLRAAEQGVRVAQAQLAAALGRLEQERTRPQQIAVREAELRSAEAQAAAAKASLDQARLNLSYTKVVAAHDGVITKRSVHEGDVVQKDQTLASLVYGEPTVTANFKETQLTHMLPGQPVDIEVDAYPGTTLKGHVDSVQRGTGARFSLLPPENATGNFVKVVQRVPVKIVFDAPPPARMVLGLGMSVVPTVDTAILPPASGQKATR
jgi:membrane fusion protein (multidrug efflux system)